MPRDVRLVCNSYIFLKMGNKCSEHEKLIILLEVWNHYTVSQREMIIMKNRKGFTFFGMVIVILVVAYLARYLAIAPFIVAVIVFLVIRSKKNSERKEEDDAQKEEKKGHSGSQYYDPHFSGQHYSGSNYSGSNYSGSNYSDPNYSGPHYSGSNYSGPYYSDPHFSENKTSTIITCDYCGSSFDTDKHPICPHCGGSYWDNEEWIRIRKKRNR